MGSLDLPALIRKSHGSLVSLFPLNTFTYFKTGLSAPNCVKGVNSPTLTLGEAISRSLAHAGQHAVSP